MSAITSNGRLLHYEVLGRGRPVIILGGFFNSIKFWANVMSSLSSQYRLYWLDFWGEEDAGASDPFQFNIENYVTHLEAFADALGIMSAAMIGHDVGGIVELLFAARHGWQGMHKPPVVAINVPMGFRDIDPRLLAALNSTRQTKEYLQQVEEKPVTRELVFNVKAIQNAILSLTMLNTYDILSRIQVPVALLYGKEDRIISPPDESHFAYLRHVSLTYLPRSRHFPMLDDPPAFLIKLGEGLSFTTRDASLPGQASAGSRRSLVELADATARIFDRRGQMIGAGFLAGRNRLVTCSHIVEAALGSMAEHAPGGEQVIQVDFPRSDRIKEPLAARVTNFDRKADIAVLELNTPGLALEPLRLVNQADLREHSFRTFGFSSQYPSGVWSGGMIQHQTSGGWIQVEENELIGHRIQAGFSGSPVWDEDLEGVVGMVVAVGDSTQSRAAYIISSLTMAESWHGFSVHRAEPVRQPKKAAKVFLCHASADKQAARDLYRLLAGDGFLPWLDEENLRPGQLWQEEIPRAIRGSDAIVVCLSKKSIAKSGYVQKEIKFALDVNDEKPEGRIFIIPLRLEECEVPERLRKFHWVDYLDDKGYERLVRSLQICADYEG